MTKIGLVVCPNRDNWHQGVYVSYIIWNTKMKDDPDYAACMKIIRSYENKELVVIERSCRYCRRRLRNQSA